MNVGDIIVVRLNDTRIYVGELAEEGALFIELSKGTVMNGDGRKEEISEGAVTLTKHYVEAVSPLWVEKELMERYKKHKWI